VKVELLTCTCIFPSPELTRHAIPGRPNEGRPARWTNWEDALKGIDNEEIRRFYEDELAHLSAAPGFAVPYT
jgi:hypothetical protein